MHEFCFHGVPTPDLPSDVSRNFIVLVGTDCGIPVPEQELDTLKASLPGTPIISNEDGSLVGRIERIWKHDLRLDAQIVLDSRFFASSVRYIPSEYEGGPSVVCFHKKDIAVN